MSIWVSEPVSRRVDYWTKFGAAALGGVILFLVGRYLTTRFDLGSPVTHAVDPYLTIGLSLLALTGTSALWLIAALDDDRAARSTEHRRIGSRTGSVAFRDPSR